MKFFDYKIRDDYGKDYNFTFLKGKRFSFIQVSFSGCEYASFPYFQITMGMGKLFGFFAYAWKFGFDVDVFGRTWWL